VSTDYLTLRENFRTGIAPVDDQHREMIGCYNDLERAVATDAPQADRVAALECLVETTRRHFRFEEHLLETHGYPDLARHRGEHSVLLEQIEDWTARLRDGELNLTRDTMRLIKAWLVDHMVGSDQHYVAHVRGAD
jgi:hemerythrin